MFHQVVTNCDPCVSLLLAAHATGCGWAFHNTFFPCRALQNVVWKGSIWMLCIIIIRFIRSINISCSSIAIWVTSEEAVIVWLSFSFTADNLIISVFLNLGSASTGCETYDRAFSRSTPCLSHSHKQKWTTHLHFLPWYKNNSKISSRTMKSEMPPTMPETIFVRKHYYSEFEVLPTIEGEDIDLHCSQPAGGDWNVLSSLLGSSHVNGFNPQPDWVWSGAQTSKVKKTTGSLWHRPLSQALVTALKKKKICLFNLCINESNLVSTYSRVSFELRMEQRREEQQLLMH